ncbi:TetR/AcrR family transcriptional regulator [Clostridium hydrogenum]|uniref:TetR/AcrR family transcriptional regulator n=1 Tax=Clostridium hydrogenum TaxID=2855764 RepID=UPI001F1E4E00|nr:TetR/AcrR family transcriptional regulator [Clostridium hydrogenum]
MKIAERKEKEKLNRRNSIIDAAEKVFFKYGFELTTVDNIAVEAGFTKKTIYSYFNSKEEIYYSIMIRGFNIINAKCEKAIKNVEIESEIEKIRIMGKCFIDFSLEYPGYFKSIVDYENNDIEAIDDLKNSVLQECYLAGEYCFELLRSIIKKGVEKKEIIDKKDVNTIALTLWAAIVGIINILDKKELYIKKYHKKAAPEVLEDGFEIILEAIKKR